ncbi:hypothetical protein Efla_005026 [Eimeria flavescens]
MAPSRCVSASSLGAEENRFVSAPGPPVEVCFQGLKHLSELVPSEDDLQKRPSQAGTLAARPTTRASHVGVLAGGPSTLARTDSGGEVVGMIRGTPSAAQQLLGRATAAGGQMPAAAEAKAQAAAGEPALPPTRKSVCVTKSGRVVSVCSLALRGQLNSVVKEPKTGKVVISLVTTAVRLSNNELTEAPDLPFHLSFLMASPAENLRWLDLSFNQLAHVPSSLEELPNLRCLYLHCNAIANAEEVLLLQNSPSLRFLTCLGNPFEQTLAKDYRIAVAAALPQLKSLDHTLFSGDEQEVACRLNPLKLLRSKPKGGLNSRQPQAAAASGPEANKAGSAK